jgi:TolA-binding protein
VDCERFDRVVLDFLYDELDELTAAAARRHVEQCARCRGIVAGLRATREVGALPLVDPPDGLELAILESERQVRGRLPLRKRAGRAVSVLAGYAMRPQLAMAALLLLAIGGGLVFFRQRPNDRDTVSVTERGVAESDPDPVAVLPKADRLEPPGDAPRPPAPAASTAAAAAAKDDSFAQSSKPAGTVAGVLAAEPRGAGDSVYQAALAAYRAGRYKEARQQFESVVAQGGSDAPLAAYYAAQSAKGGEGCGVAAALFDQVSQRYPGSRAGYDATWEAATCYETLGDTEKARRSYQALLDEASYAARARSAIAQLDRVEGPPAAIATRRKAAAKVAEEPAEAAPKGGSPSTDGEAEPGRGVPVAPPQGRGLRPMPTDVAH